MKKIITSLFITCATICNSQEIKNYIFNVELNDFHEAPVFIKKNNELIYNGTIQAEKDFFSKYAILDFFQSYPDSKRLRTLNMFTVVTTDKSLISSILAQFPSKYLRVEDLTGVKVELTSRYYPNDYGSTSPTTNLGVNGSLKSFDYVDVPKAWNYTTGNDNILLGWSDAKIDTTDIDFKFKTSFLQDYYTVGYPGMPYDANNIETWHGTGTAAVAGAQGNNSHGITGICMDCQIIATAYGFGNPGSPLSPTPNYNNLLKLANSGVKVINMSWAHMDQNPNGHWTSFQWVIDEIHDLGVVLVAGAGNTNSYSSIYAPNFLVYGFPASLNHVISVSSVNHKNKAIGEEITNEPFGQVSWNVEDLISPTGIMNNNGVYYTSYYEGHTTNEKVDICAPGFKNFRYEQYLGLGQIQYGDGTSGATPFVTGTVGLMFSINDCLTPDEVEDILQLTSKNIESNPYNSYFIGRIGSGKLETGNAIEFVVESLSPNGNARISNQDFWRFNFDLQYINNNLTISYQTFRDNNTSNFVAKNSIEIFEDSDFKPNTNGFIDLKINNNLEVCPVSASRITNIYKKTKNIVENNINRVILYPNPNKGYFTIALNKEELSGTTIEIFDIYGKLLFKDMTLKKQIEINNQSLPTGIYFAKIVSDNINQTIKFIKN